MEISGKQRIVQYRNSILPLINLNDCFNFSKPKIGTNQSSDGKISVIVVQRGNKSYGIEVDEVVDILSVAGTIEDPLMELDGILGSIIVKDTVATVVDVYGVLDKVLGIAKSKEASKNAPTSLDFRSVKVLLAEDTVFFMKQVRKLLESKGMQVVHAVDGSEAYRILKESKPGEYQLLISDIEMPNMNGFQLAEKVRVDDSMKLLPMIALTTRFKEADRALGSKVGFNRYLEKLRSDQLLIAIQEVLTQRSA